MEKILIYRKREIYMLVFFIILVSLILICCLIYWSGIKIQIEKIEIERKDQIKINNFKINIYFMLFSKAKIIKIEIDKEKIEKINFKKLSEKISGKNKKLNRNLLLKSLKNLKIEIAGLNIIAKCGFNNVVLMAYLVTIINIILSIVYAKITNGYKNKNYNYSIKLFQTDKLYLKITINCIINVKIANIINMIIMNRSEIKNEGTSNRIFNGNSHEQYTRYGRRKYYNRSAN